MKDLIDYLNSEMERISYVPAVKSKCVINCSDKDAETVVKTLQQADDDIDVFRKLVPPNVVYDVL